MTDSFGNYLCQKLLLSCGVEQRLELVKKVVCDYNQEYRCGDECWRSAWISKGHT